MPRIRWTKEDVNRAFNEALSGQKAQPEQSNLSAMAQKVKEFVTRNKK